MATESMTLAKQMNNRTLHTYSRGAYHVLRGVAESVRHLFVRDRFGMSWRDEKRLQYSPRLMHTEAPLLGKRITITDPYWYLFCYREIFEDEIYKFKTNNPAPLIIDCGANVGLSVIYFKHLYPKARVIAFEPDKEVFAVLQRNMSTFQLGDVALYPKAVWNSETELPFQSDGSVGGRISSNGDGNPVRTARLKDFLDQEIDFLKIDIEGAEYEVLIDCADLLKNVDHLFVEHHGRENAQESFDGILHILRGAGFRYHVKEAWPVMHPFIPEERPDYSLQLNVFAYREANQLPQ